MARKPHQDARPRAWWLRWLSPSVPLKATEFTESAEALDTELGRDALRQMIARKRQNDAIRQREFDYLRKLRKQSPAAFTQASGPASLFPDSVAYHAQVRTVTLEKINQIEAQFSHQGWLGPPALRPSGAPPQAAEAAQLSAAAAEPMHGGAARRKPANLPAGLAESADPAGNAHSAREFVPTRMPSLWPQAPLSVCEPVPGYVASEPAWSEPAGWSQPAEVLSDPELEEAAIRYANHDPHGAEAVLLAALQGPPARADQVQSWLSALFDLYRATGQQDRFDAMAIEFAQRHGRSAPAWEDLAQAVAARVMHASLPDSAAPQKTTAPALWACPAVLDEAAVQQLQALSVAALARAPLQPQVLDWRAIQSVLPPAQSALAALLVHWCGQPVTLQMLGASQWLRCLQALTPPADRNVPASAWGLRLQALRLLGLQQAFELVALDYCMIYEVSPPSWQPPRCTCGADSLSSEWGESYAATQADASVSALGAADAMPTLQGELLGDVSATLARLVSSLAESERLVIACPYLIRVDFPAAGCILNWVRDQHGLGREVQLRDVPRMVAAFLCLVGIDEFALILPRQN